MPGWSVVDDEAEQMRMTLPAYLEWATTEQGHAWLPRLRIKWAIQGVARQREYAAMRRGERDQSDAAWARDGWRGGACDPDEFSVFDDGASEAAA